MSDGLRASGDGALIGAHPQRPRVLILTASVGEGHDLPARALASALEDAAQVEILDVLSVMGASVEIAAQRSLAASFGAGRMPWLFELEYLLFARFPPTRMLGQALLYRLAGGRLHDAVASRDPDVVVSTYPISSEVLGRLRHDGRLDRPVCSVITDVAALRYWAHRGCDLHLTAYPESATEIDEIAGLGAAHVVHGLTAAAFLAPPDRGEARRRLDLPVAARVIAISGGGWGVGSVERAAAFALEIPEAYVLCLCGRNARLRARLAQTFAADDRVRVLGFVEDMTTLLTAADVLVHSTGGLTVLEARMVGTPVISYGFAIGHIRLNDAAFARHGLAAVVSPRGDLPAAIRRALAQPRNPQAQRFAELPAAAPLILELASRSTHRS